jgi:atlastin
MTMSSESDESAVIVEHDDAPELTDEGDNANHQKDDKEEDTDDAARQEKDTTSTKTNNQEPHPFQIVSIGSEDNAYAFHFENQALTEILGRIPADYKVAVVSVVGAFRTGKSFLLSWFLRYLKYLETKDSDDNKTDKDDSTPWYKTIESVGNEGFDWKAGSERHTTGIWMWSHPHLIKNAAGDKIAVLLVDTQGMFDHETTMALTASIFGFSTLLSSYQIYNVDKRIQEDNLQQLALFSEYARTAMAGDKEAKEAVAQEKEKESKKGEDVSSTESVMPKPFQQMEFLVRDWQHFDDEEDEEGEENYEAMEKSMEAYLDTVIAERDAKDLQDTREQIQSCFEKITCYGLSHPGFAVTKKKFTGDVDSIEPQFLNLLDRYCARVFDPVNLKPKVIHGRELTATELGTYIQTYADLFASGAKFPTAATLLEATASANNTNAVYRALASYKETMDRVAGPHCDNYVKPEELKEEHRLAEAATMEIFESIATFGSKGSIKEARVKVEDQLASSFEVYDSLNNGRNPLLGLETYVDTHILVTYSCLLTTARFSLPFVLFLPQILASHGNRSNGDCFAVAYRLDLLAVLASLQGWE